MSGAASIAHLVGRVRVVEERVRGLVANRRAHDPAPDDPFRGLYLSEDTVETMRALVNEHVTRCAVIGQTSRAARVERLFSAGTKAELRHFSDTEDAQAWAWIGARELK